MGLGLCEPRHRISDVDTTCIPQATTEKWAEQLAHKWSLLFIFRICTGGHFGYTGIKQDQEALESAQRSHSATPTTVQIDYYGRCSIMSIWKKLIKISIPVNNSHTVSRPGATLHACAQGRGLQHSGSRDSHRMCTPMGTCSAQSRGQAAQALSISGLERTTEVTSLTLIKVNSCVNCTFLFLRRRNVQI